MFQNSPLNHSQSISERFALTDGESLSLEIGDGLTLRGIRRGPETGDAPFFLLIHGLASNARMWDGVGRALADTGMPSLALDLRGHGRSSKPDHGYDFDTICADLVAVLDRCGIERAVLVGQSWGGNIVVHAAHRIPERVHSVVAVDGGIIELGSVFPKWEDCAHRLQPPRLAGTRAGRLESAIRSMNADWPESGLVGSLSNFQFHEDGTISPWLTFERHMIILAELWRHRPSQLFPGIDRPVLFMPADSGDVNWTHDKERAIDKALTALSRGRVHWFRPAHHDLHAQHPERCAEVLVDHVKDGFLV
ncbi:MAG: alpha/beta fold hydrolase [Ilumatobacteraceae bacterium]